MDYHFFSLYSYIDAKDTTTASTDFSNNFLHTIRQSHKILNKVFSNMQRDTLHVDCNAHFFINCTFESLQFNESNFSLCTFYNCNFYDCRFFDCSLETMGLFNCAFTDCTIQESILNYSRFIDGTISSLYIEDCNLQGTMFYLDKAHTRNIMIQYSNDEDAYFNE